MRKATNAKADGLLYNSETKLGPSITPHWISQLKVLHIQLSVIKINIMKALCSLKSTLSKIQNNQKSINTLNSPRNWKIEVKSSEPRHYSFTAFH